MQVLPIPMVTLRCEKNCCSVTFCPLELSFGMTLHTFQGQSAGPVDAGQPTNAVDRIIVEPGTRTFEGNNPGILYMAASRATTMGTAFEDNDAKSTSTDSAIYFTGPNMNRGRIVDIKYRQSTAGSKQLYKKVALREKWVARLEKNMVKPQYDQEYIDEMKQWCHEFRMSTEDLDEALANRAWRTNLRRSTNY